MATPSTRMLFSPATVRSLPSGHASMVSHPKEVADIITLAAESGRLVAAVG